MINHKSQVTRNKKITNNKSQVLYLVSCILDFAAAQQGQALITLLFFMVMGITITSAAVVILVTNIRASSSVEQGLTAYYIAESGAEEGMLQILRNPLYAGSETISVDGGVATMSAMQGNPITILS